MCWDEDGDHGLKLMRVWLKVWNWDDFNWNFHTKSLVPVGSKNGGEEEEMESGVRM